MKTNYQVLTGSNPISNFSNNFLYLSFRIIRIDITQHTVPEKLWPLNFLLNWNGCNLSVNLQANSSDSEPCCPPPKKGLLITVLPASEGDQFRQQFCLHWNVFSRTQETFSLNELLLGFSSSHFDIFISFYEINQPEPKKH